jgi:hypothetical protein
LQEIWYVIQVGGYGNNDGDGSIPVGDDGSNDDGSDDGDEVIVKWWW